MKTARLFFYPLISLMMLLPAGCKQAATSSSNEQRPASSAVSNGNQMPANVNSNQNQPAPQASAETGKSESATASPRLLGSYEMSEVSKEGVTTKLSRLQTTFIFRPDGSYARVSKKDSKMYHGDGGRFRVEGSDKLILTIIVSNKQGRLPKPLEVTKTFKISPDGEEIRMTSDDGKTAIFRRVTNKQ